jgi:hypothetical protein
MNTFPRLSISLVSDSELLFLVYRCFTRCGPLIMGYVYSYVFFNYIIGLLLLWEFMSMTTSTIDL